VKRTLGTWLQVAVLVPIVACLLVGGCQWGLIKSPGSASVFPTDARLWPPPAPPVEDSTTDPPPSGFSTEDIPPIAATAGKNTAPQGQPPAPGPKPYSLEQCRHLTLGNNPDLQVEAWEQAAKSAFAYASKMKVLPRPGLAAELSNRDNLLYPYDSGTDTLAWSYPLERATWRYFLELKWSPTDALQGYYLTNNECNDSAKAGYQRLRVSQKLLGSADAAFYRLLSLQQCLPLAERLSRLRANVAKEAKSLRQDRLNDLEDYLRTEEKASIARHRLTRIRVELERQKILLASLMGLLPQDCPQGVFVAGELVQPAFQICTTDLEMQALTYRPEAQIEGLNRINSVNDLRRATVKYFPKVSTFYRFGKDLGYKRSDRNIDDFGLLFYLDLLDVFTNTKEATGLQAKRAKADQRMSAMALAIATEVRMAVLRCMEADEELQTIHASLERAKKQLQVAKGKAKVGVLENVAVEDAQGTVLQEDIERIRSIGEGNARLAELQCAVGMNYCEGIAQR
jgi:outer membrane protein TolC